MSSGSLVCSLRLPDTAQLLNAYVILQGDGGGLFSLDRLRTGALTSVVLVTMGGLTAASAAHAAIACTVSLGVTQSETTVTGTDLADTIDCSEASPGKTISGLAGDDTITGTAFSDTIDGGLGNDTLTSGPAVSLEDDTVTGGEGNDILNGDAGVDRLDGEAGDDDLAGDSADGSVDQLDGGPDTDFCQGPAPDGDVHTNCNPRSLRPPEHAGVDPGR